MSPNKCPEHSILLAYQRGELTVADLDAVTAHLDTCATCESVAQSLDDSTEPILEALRRLPAGEREALKNLDGGGPNGELKVRILPMAHENPDDPSGATLGLSAEVAAMPMHLGVYQVLEELGRGGMGVVYKAWHPGLRRHVALKVVRAGVHASADETIRFHREAELIARVSHPNLVQIYEIGQHNGLPFIVLEFLPGGSLDTRLGGLPQPARRAAELVATLGEAVQTAHQHGVIHRDLKPANVLLTDDGTPKIADFGLARRLDGPGVSRASGIVVGTPSYMAPEQVAHPNDIGPQADVYALGAILYECLTGRPPFRAESAQETFRQLLADDPVSPSKLQPKLPRDLVTVCLRCLEKDPLRRYPSAGELVADLRRFLGGQPVLARPITPLERAVKWAHRSPTVAGLIGALVVGAVCAFIAISLLWIQAEHRAKDAAVARDAESEARRRAEETSTRERQARQETERVSAALTLDQGIALCEKGDISTGLLTLAEAVARAQQAGDAMSERIARLQLSAWQHELIRPIERLRHGANITSVAYSRDGRLVATGSRDGTVHLWDAATGARQGQSLTHPLPIYSLTFSPDGKSLLTGSGPEGEGEGEVQIWSVEFPHRAPWVRRMPDSVLKVEFAEQGDRFLAVCPREVQVWQGDSRVPLREPLRHDGEVKAAAFSPDGKLILTGGADSLGRLWEADTGKPRGELKGHTRAVTCVAFSPDGGRLAVTGSLDHNARIWNVETQEQQGSNLSHQGQVRTVVFSPRGDMIATGTRIGQNDLERNLSLSWVGEAKLWTAAGRQLGEPMLHPSTVWSVAFGRDGKLLATGCEDGQARLFATGTGALIGRPLVHTGTVRQVAFSPDSTTFVGAGDGGDSRIGAFAGLWRVPEKRSVDALPPLQWRTSFRKLAFSPDGRHLLGCYQDRSGINGLLVDAKTGRPVLAPLEHSGTACSLAFSPDGKTLATGARDGYLRLWDRRTGKLLRRCKLGVDVSPLAFSPDSQFVAGYSMDRMVRVWRVSDGLQEGNALKQPDNVEIMQFGEEEGLLWIVGADHVVRKGNFRTGVVNEVWSAPGELRAPAFGPEGRTLVSACAEGRGVQVHDLATGRLESTPMQYPNSAIDRLTVSPDRRFAVSVGGRGARLWDLQTGRHIGRGLDQYSWALAATFAPDSKTFAVGGDSSLQVYEVPEAIGGTPEQIRSWAELLTESHLDGGGVVRELTGDELQTRLRQQKARPSGAVTPR